MAPATIAPGSANSWSKVSRGRCTMSTQALDPIITVHPTDASARARDSTACSWSASVPSTPPWLRGRSIPKQPALDSCVTRSGRQPTGRLGLRGPGGHRRDQLVDRGQDRLGESGTSSSGLAHACSLGRRGGLVTGGWVAGSGRPAGRSRRRMGASAACRLRSASSQSPLQKTVISAIRSARTVQTCSRRAVRSPRSGTVSDVRCSARNPSSVAVVRTTVTSGPWATYSSSQVANSSSPWIWNRQNGGWPSRKKSVVNRSATTPVRKASASPALSCSTSRSMVCRCRGHAPDARDAAGRGRIGRTVQFPGRAWVVLCSS